MSIECCTWDIWMFVYVYILCACACGPISDSTENQNNHFWRRVVAALAWPWMNLVYTIAPARSASALILFRDGRPHLRSAPKLPTHVIITKTMCLRYGHRYMMHTMNIILCARIVYAKRECYEKLVRETKKCNLDRCAYFWFWSIINVVEVKHK
jgi:hypothetical protein